MLLGYSFWIGLAGGAFLAYLGLRTLTAPAVPASAAAEAKSLSTSFLSTPGLFGSAASARD